MGQKTYQIVNPVDPVASQIAQQQLARQQAIADALRERSSQPLQGNGGNIAWTQGLAQIGQALAARIMQNRIDKRTADVGYAADRAMFGGPPQVNQPAAYKAPIAEQMAPPQTIDLPGRGAVPLGTQPEAAPQQPADAPQMPPQEQAPQQQPQQSSDYLMAYTGDRAQDRAMYYQAPEEYRKAVIAAHAPTDVMKELISQHIPPGSPLWNQIMLSKTQKDTQTPLNDDKRGYLTDPYTGQVKAFHPQLESGATPLFDENGRVIGQRLLDGTLQATADSAAASAGGRSAGEAPYHMVQRLNPQTNQPEWVSVAELAGNSPTGSQPAGNSPGGRHGAGGPGSIDAALTGNNPSITGNPRATGLRPGDQAALEVRAKSSAERYAAIQNAAQESPQRVSALREMRGLVTSGGLSTGPMRERMQAMAEKSGLSFLAQNNAFLFNKDTARYTAQLAGELGLSGSDQRLGLVGKATPGMQIPAAVLPQVIDTYLGLELAKQAQANGSVGYARDHPADASNYDAWWRKNYDPSMFTQLARGMPAFVANIRKLNPASQKHYGQMYDALYNAGALQGLVP